MHDSWDKYTPEEVLLETWEQYFLENPDSLAAAGINKCVDATTGFKYYKTGDPLIDRLEEAFGRGELPDLDEAFGNVKGGTDIFRSEIWQDNEGNAIVPNMEAPKVVTWSDKGEKINEAGNKVEIADFTSDDWLEQGLEDDPFLKGLAKQWGITNG